jgi:hypothetical protein
MKLLKNEAFLYRSEDDDVILTTHRVRSGGDSEFTSIMLEQICSIVVERKTNRWWMIAALVAFGIAAYLGITAYSYVPLAPYSEYQGVAIGAAVIGALLFFAYFATRVTVAEIASAAAAIRFQGSGRHMAGILELMELLESAKNERYLLNGVKPSET